MSLEVGIGFVWHTCLVKFAEEGFLGERRWRVAGKAADLKTEIRATGLRRSWAYKLLI